MAIIRTTGYIQLRRGIQEHITNGSMSLSQLGIYALIVMNADPATGIWCGSAGVISALASQSPRTCRDAFETLEKSGYIKRFATVGKHGSYPILVHKFECTDGAMKGSKLNAIDTVDYTTPKYCSCDERVNEGGNDGVNESATNNKRTRELEKKEYISPGKAEIEDLLQAGFRYFLESTHRSIAQYKLSPDRRKMGLAGIATLIAFAKECGDEEPISRAAKMLNFAIDRMTSHPWNSGLTSGTAYNGWEYLFRGSGFKSPNRLLEGWLDPNYKDPR